MVFGRLPGFGGPGSFDQLGCSTRFLWDRFVIEEGALESEKDRAVQPCFNGDDVAWPYPQRLNRRDLKESVVVTKGEVVGQHPGNPDGKNFIDFLMGQQGTMGIEAMGGGHGKTIVVAGDIDFLEESVGGGDI